MTNSNRPGFTLVELLVVIAIIGILSSLSTVALTSARSRARDAQRRGDLRQVYTALQLYYDVRDTYPDMSNAAWWSQLSTYLLTQPLDPRTKLAYHALDNSSVRQQFCIYVALESEPLYIISTERGLRTKASPPQDDLMENCYN